MLKSLISLIALFTHPFAHLRQSFHYLIIVFNFVTIVLIYAKIRQL